MDIVKPADVTITNISSVQIYFKPRMFFMFMIRLKMMLENYCNLPSYQLLQQEIESQC